MPTVNEDDCINDEIRDSSKLSTATECARTCHKGAKPKICYYKFMVERYPISGQACSLCTPNVTTHICANCQCVPGNGVQRMGLLVNRMMPGPAINVCQGDKIVVDVENGIKEDAISIHWHGVFQKGTQHYDGVPSLTQCPITFRTTFRYAFYANNCGTHFWHAHTGLQKMDGIFGSLIVREPVETDLYAKLYDFDLVQHIIVINDWMDELATERHPGRISGVVLQHPDAVLINGRGNYTVNMLTSTNIPLEVFTVEPNQRYRFRLINAFCAVCPGELTIEGHNVTVITTDGLKVKPTVVDTIISFPAERFDFILETNQRPGTYWIQLRLIGVCSQLLGRSIQQLAKIQYLGKTQRPTSPMPTYNQTLPSKITLNPLDGDCNVKRPNLICISDLRNFGYIDSGIEKQEPDVKLFLALGFNNIPSAQFFKPNEYEDFFVVPNPSLDLNAHMNGITFRFPPSPPISQLKDLDQSQFCNDTHIPSTCKQNSTCSCTHIINLPLDAIVEIVLVDEGGAGFLNHPFHLHGSGFHVLTMSQPYGTLVNATRNITRDHIRDLDRQGKLPRNLKAPPGKDTIPVPNNGYIVIRFRASNPGVWLFHCHFVFHQQVGMELIFRVGNQDDVPKTPKGFPKCGDFKPMIKHIDNDSCEKKPARSQEEWVEKPPRLYEESEEERPIYSIRKPIWWPIKGLH
ncbi:Laccase-5 [Dufourea novaeangliae]|uniref:Laccase-5 n=1 Tax=Dufourea novaeangliae TaxID=178035 RepID=A0A154NX17_DUFNO|nr:Laccase-5 [Dufourea novaeangliae]